MVRRRDGRFRRIIILVIFILIGILIIFFLRREKDFDKSFFHNRREISDIMAKIPRRYQRNVDITSNNGKLKGKIIRDENDVTFEINEPGVLAGMQIKYENKGINLKYKEMELKTSNNVMLQYFPVSKIIEVENIIYNGYYDKYEIKGDELSIEDKYNNENFKFKLDLRQNKINSIYLEEGNITAEYQSN